MTREQWARLQPLFHGALEQPAGARDEWLRRACPDEELRREALTLIQAHETAGDFLDAPPVLAAEPGDAIDDPLSMQPGQHIGPYVIEAEIGRGGMGIVYRARDVRLGRLVALKALPPALALDERRRKRLRREARAAAGLTHPGIAVVYALEEIDDHLFIASEHLNGRTLRAEMAGRGLGTQRAVEVALDLARALAAAHAAGVVHRDLKPENVLLTDDGRIKVLDFGIAHITEDANGQAVSQLTMEGAALGTPAYMAPEQLLGGDVDFRADIYALGVLLVEMATGIHPLSPGGRPAVDPRIAGIVERCLATNREQRFDSTRQLVAALERASSSTAATDAAVASTTAPDAVWWWEFHQGVAALVYGVMMIPLWAARGVIGGLPGRVIFIAGLAAATVTAILRLHLWFTSRSYGSQLRWVRQRVGRWITLADWAFVLALAVAGLMVGETRAPLAILLLSVGIGSAVAFLVIEPVTARAAFPPEP